VQGAGYMCHSLTEYSREIYRVFLKYTVRLYGRVLCTRTMENIYVNIGYRTWPNLFYNENDKKKL
jgi:hypothetical protein